MDHRGIRLLGVLATVAALIAVPGAARATAAPTPGPPVVQPTIVITPLGVSPVKSRSCAMPYLATPYGPIAQCTEIFSIIATPGLYSPFTGHFGPHSSTSYPIKKQDYYYATVPSTDGFTGIAIGYATLGTTRDYTVWATQYAGNQGRWGTVNADTNVFTPTHPWYDVVR
jgi:hypothetical protein